MEEDRIFGNLSSGVKPDLHSSRPWGLAMSDDKSSRPIPPPSRDWTGEDSARPTDWDRWECLMPKKQNPETPEDQSKRFEREAQKLIDAGEISPTDAYK